MSGNAVGEKRDREPGTAASPPPAKKFQATLDAMLSRCPDLVLQFPEAQDKIETHQMMLMQSSEVFHDMLSNQEWEGQEGGGVTVTGRGQKVEVTLCTDDPAAWRELLQRIYPVYPPPPRLTEAIVNRILPIAHKYNFVGVVGHIMQWFAKELSAQPSAPRQFGNSVPPVVNLKWLVLADHLQLEDLRKLYFEHAEAHCSSCPQPQRQACTQCTGCSTRKALSKAMCYSNASLIFDKLDRESVVKLLRIMGGLPVEEATQ